MNTYPIDIVVTFLDNSDKNWQKEFYKYKKEEIKNRITQAENSQAFGKDRFREWDVFKYWFRGVEKNCSWVNKIFLIVQSETQIPKWLNKNHPKLRIVYHEEYIPKELLPTFNDRPIEFYTCFIKDLSKNYIRSNDDCYFLNPIPEDMFFKNDRPVLPDNQRPFEFFEAKGSGATFWGALNNNLELEKEYLNGKNYTYGIAHLQMACDKNFELKIINNHKEKFLSALSYSRFRSEKHYTIYLFDDLERICENAILDKNIFNTSCYCYLNKNLNFEDIKNKLCVCLNDTDKANSDYSLIKKNMQKFFEDKFPNKSSFEI